MNTVLVLLAAAIFPVACMGLLFWLARLEDTLDASLKNLTKLVPLRAVPAAETSLTAARPLAARDDADRSALPAVS